MKLTARNSVVALTVLGLYGCATRTPVAVAPAAAPVVEAQQVAPQHSEGYMDAHFHISNYAYQGASLKTLIDHYMRDKISRSVVMPLPLQQKWDGFEHYAQDKIAPTYYIGPKAELYYYAFADAMIAQEYATLSPKDKARLDPMITGFNPMDRYAAQHIKRVLLTFPGVFSGIGEFTIHKEVVSGKIAGDPIKAVSSVKLPADATGTSKLSLYSPALIGIFNVAAETGLVATLHNDMYETHIKYDGTVKRKSPQKTYVDALKSVCKASPQATVIWAHTGLGRFVKPTADHLKRVGEVLKACPNWYVDISWDLVQKVIVAPEAGMPSLAQWAEFIRVYQDRVLWGSDTVIYSRNKVENGQVVQGKRMSAEEYSAVPEVSNPLWNVLGPEISRKVKSANYVRLFDAARIKVRAWEAAHAHDDVWNLK